MLPVKLDQAAIDVAIQSLPVNFSQAKKMLQYLGSNPNAVKVDVNRECGISNLSDIAKKANQHLIKHQLFISCQRPVMPRKNRPQMSSNMFLWGVYRMPEAANNDFFDMGYSNGKRR